MSTFTTTASETFTVTHARHISARIKTDLKRLTMLYPTNLTEQRIEDFHTEALEHLRHGYLESVTYGFRSETENLLGFKYIQWVLALKYVLVDGELDGGSDSPGGIQPGKDLAGIPFYSYLTRTQKYWNLTESERASFLSTLPIRRVGSEEPSANWTQDRAYGKGGIYVNRLISYPD